MALHARHFATVAAAAALLSSCGGGGERPSSGSPPTPTPSPSPTPTPTAIQPPLPPGPVGLTGERFRTVSAHVDGWGSIETGTDAVRISHSAVRNQYTVTLPSFAEGRLIPVAGNGTASASGWIELESTLSDVTDGSSQQLQNVGVTLDWPGTSEYTYTSFGSWFGSAPMGENNGVFAYGIPTAAGDMPVSGVARYDGDVRGRTNGEPGSGGAIGPIVDVFGTVSLTFDFGAGTLSGEMRPEIATSRNPAPLGVYSFRDTLYTSGSTSFSGEFQVPGSSAPSAFSGSFNGPQGSELMANWIAPFEFPSNGGWGTMAGVWIAKKDP